MVNDPTELKTASGCFGLLGVVLSLTLRLEEMRVAKMVPTNIDMFLAIPPPEGYKILPVLENQMIQRNITPAKLAAARKAFIKRCEEDYYLEWFWFPYQKDCWVNTWQRKSSSL